MRNRAVWSKGIFAVAVVVVLTLSVGVGVAATGHSPVVAAPPTSAAVAASVAASSVRAAAPAAPAAASAPAAVTPDGAGPHPGTLDIYENTGGGTTMDPASAYNTVNAEPIWNVYETLVAYNGTDTGSSPGSFVPQLATCVPGSAECTTQFGQNLTFANGTHTANTQYYTFEIDAGARFYDPNTTASWPVYPSDVVFSLARTMAFSLMPFREAYPGWIQTQALLPNGSSTWDGGIHYPYNNTPSHIMSAILVNDSAYCPAPVEPGIHTNGCVTFNVGPSGVPWPDFLQLLADPMGGGIVPCGKFTAEGAGVPGFNGSSAAHGDGACTLPYGATSTSQTSYARYLASLTPTAWDAYEVAAGDNYPSAQPAIQWDLFGSGPYYATEVDSSTGYFLKANPDYHAPVGCVGQAGCLPAPGDYAATVNVYWSSGDTAGLQAMAGGIADTAEIFPADFGDLQSLVASGKYALIQNIPTLSFFFAPFELNFSTTAEAQIDSTGLLNIPGTWFSNLAVREFMVNAMPYTTLLSEVYTSAGIVTGEAYGGVIPHGMGNYYPANISWPTGNPTSDASKVGNVTWWWNQATTKGSQWYDPTAAACSSSHPCRFPVISITGFSVYDDQANLWIQSIKTLSGNALQPYLLDIPATTEATSVGLPPGEGNMPDYPYGWAPDYPDPTDNVPTMFGSAGTYTVPDAVDQQMTLPANMNASAPACAGHTTDLTSFASLVYWANVGQVANACQGFAYTTMNNWINIAGPLTDVAQREVDYNLIEHIANELALYMYSNQGVGLEDYAAWINPAGINTNPMIGGGGDQLWSFWTYSDKVYNVTVSESGLPTATQWSATVGGTTLSTITSGTSASIVFPGLPNGTYNFSVQFEPGFSVTPASGEVKIAGVNLTQSVVYTSFSTPTADLTFNETGLVTNTTWSIVVTGYGSLRGPNPSLVFPLPESSTYTYTPQFVPGYIAPAGGSVPLGTTPKSVTVPYASLIPTYSVRFSEVGLPVGSTWSVTLGAPGFAYTSTVTANNTTFYEQNGSYPVSFTLPAGYVAPVPSAYVVVNGADLNVSLTLALAQDTYLVTFLEWGMPIGFNLAWNITVSNLTVVSKTPGLNYSLPNGTYGWAVTPPPGFNATPFGGAVTVAGNNTSVGVIFQPLPVTYAVTFTTSSLPTGGAWTIYFGGVNKTSAGPSITFLVVNGVWTFAVVGPTGYVANPTGGTVTVNGQGSTMTVGFTKSSTSSTAWTYLSRLAYIAIGVLAVLMVIGFALAVRSARRRAPPTPPESWTEGGAASGGAAGSGGAASESTTAAPPPPEGSPPPSP